jgi:hypothetical protein
MRETEDIAQFIQRIQDALSRLGDADISGDFGYEACLTVKHGKYGHAEVYPDYSGSPITPDELLWRIDVYSYPDARTRTLVRTLTMPRG